MHGFGWQGNVFFALLLYGFIIPIALAWIGLVFVKSPKPVVWVITEVSLHIFALGWVVELNKNPWLITVVVVMFVAYQAAFIKSVQKIQSNLDLYSSEIRVVQPNELKK